MTRKLRPSIGELVPGYLSVGIPKRQAVRYIVDSHLRSRLARGKGNRAARRQAHVELLKLPISGAVFFSPLLRDQLAELFSEARVHRNVRLNNPHE
jgi:hypothetical protein